MTSIYKGTGGGDTVGQEFKKSHKLPQKFLFSGVSSTK